MDDTQFKPLIGAIFQTVVVGDIHTRVRYCGVLINHISQYIQTEKYARDPYSINTMKTTLAKIVFNIISLQTAQLPEDKKIELQTDITKKFISLFTPVESWQTDAARYGTETLLEITQLNLARTYYNKALVEYSDAMAGSAPGYAAAMKSIESVMTILSEIAYNNDMITLSADAWHKVIKAQAAGIAEKTQ